MTDPVGKSYPTVLYIGGTGRSGSTLLARELGKIPGFAAVGELRYVLRRGVLEDHLCGCGETFRSCPFWKDVFNVAFGGMDSDAAHHMLVVSSRIDRIRFIPQLWNPRLRSRSFRKQWAEYSDLLSSLYSAVAQVSGGRVVVDSSKDPSYAFVLRSTPNIELSVVHLLRDSRAVAFSWLRPKVRPEIHWKLEHMRKRAPARSSVLWAEYHLLFELLDRAGTRMRRLSYEEFARAPAQNLAELCDWMGGPDEESPFAGTPFVHDISGNPIRFAVGPFEVREDDEWKTAMSARDRRVVTALTSPLLARYGYTGRAKLRQ